MQAFSGQVGGPGADGAARAQLRVPPCRDLDGGAPRCLVGLGFADGDPQPAFGVADVGDLTAPAGHGPAQQDHRAVAQSGGGGQVQGLDHRAQVAGEQRGRADRAGRAGRAVGVVGPLRLEADLESAERRAERAESELHTTGEARSETNGRLAVATDRKARAEEDLKQLTNRLATETTARTAAEEHGADLRRQLTGLQAALEHSQTQARAERDARENTERRASEAADKAERDLRGVIAREREAHSRESAALEKALAAETARADSAERAREQSPAVSA